MFENIKIENILYLMKMIFFRNKIITAYFIFFIFCFTGFDRLYSAPVKFKLLYAAGITEIETRNSSGGLAELGSAVKYYRKTEDNFIFLHGGDSLAPSIMSSFDYGTHMIDILNSILPEAMAIADREFAHKEDELILRISEAAFPLISSNITDPLTGKNLEGARSHRIFSIEGYRIGVFSIINPDLQETYLPERIKIDSSPGFIEKKAQLMRDEGADIIILLSDYRPRESDRLLESGLIDIILQSDSDSDRIIPIKKGFYALHGSSDGQYLLLDLTLNKVNGVIDMKAGGSFIALSSFKQDNEIQDKINYYTNTLNKVMNVAVGKTAVPLDTSRNKIRTEENAFGNFVADAMRDYYGTDIAVFNGGSIRGNRMYKPGEEFTRKTIQGELPYYNKVLPVYIRGEDIYSMLEHGLSRIEEIKGGFLHVSGMSLSYCPTEERGKRLKSVNIGSELLKRDKIYTLTLIDYLKNGGDGFHMFKKSNPVPTEKESLYSWEVIRLYIEKQEIISPKIEGRLLQDCR